MIYLERNNLYISMFIRFLPSSAAMASFHHTDINSIPFHRIRFIYFKVNLVQAKQYAANKHSVVIIMNLI